MEYELYHHGILGMKWGVRRYQNKDGSLTAAGRKRYGSKEVADVDKRLTEYNNIKGKTPAQHIQEGVDLHSTVGKVIADHRPELVSLQREYLSALNEFGFESSRIYNQAVKVAKERGLSPKIDDTDVEDISIELSAKSKSYQQAYKKVKAAFEQKTKAEKKAVSDFLGEIGGEKLKNIQIGQNKNLTKADVAYTAVAGYISDYVRKHPKEGYHWEYSGGFDGKKIWDSKKLVKDK